MIKHTVFALFLGLLIFFLYLAQYLGAFRSVTIGIENQNEMTLLYQEHFGPYHKIVPVIEKIEKAMKEKNLDCSLSFGEYLDNPRTIEEGRLRSNGGCIVKKEDFEKVTELLKSEFKDFKLKTRPAGRYTIAHFEGSPGIGPMKVYPKVEEFIKENQLTLDGPTLEIYQVHDSKTMSTVYYFPIK